MKPRLVTIQFALHFKKIIIAPEKYFDEINSALDGIFQDPIVQPVPYSHNDESLAEIPVVQSISEDNKYDLRLARGRIDIIFNSTSDDLTYDHLHQDVLKKAGLVTSLISKVVPIDWVGLLLTYIVVSDSPGKMNIKAIKSNLLEINEGEGLNFYVRNSNKVNVGDVESNNQISISTGTAQSPKENIRGLLISQDFNTKISSNEINEDFIQAYIENIKPLIKIDEIKELLEK